MEVSITAGQHVHGCNSAIKVEFQKNKYAKSILFTTWIKTHDLQNASHLLYPLSYMDVVFSEMLLEFSPLLRLQFAAERKLITALTCSDKFEVGG